MRSEMTVPRINANDDHVEIAHWYVKDGDFIEKGRDIADLGTSKANVTITSEFSGFVRLAFKTGEKAAVGAPMAYFFQDKAEALADKTIGQKAAAKETKSAGGTRPQRHLFKVAKPSSDAPRFPFTRFSKAAEQLLIDAGIDKSIFEGMGLVTLPVVESMMGGGQSASSKLAATLSSENAAYKRSKAVNKLKALEIESLTIGQSGNIVSSLTVQFESAPVIATLRKSNSFNGSVLPLILYELGKLLAENPNFTAYYEDGNFFYYDEVNIGLAIDIGKGLKVVTLRNAPKLFPAEIFTAMTEFAMKDMSGTLSETDVTGSTFTVTDLTAQNILHFQPLINGRQAAILGIGGDTEMPGRPLTLTIAFDHRVLTGRDVSEFLSQLKANVLKYADAPVPAGGH